MGKNRGKNKNNFIKGNNNGEDVKKNMQYDYIQQEEEEEEEEKEKEKKEKNKG